MTQATRSKPGRNKQQTPLPPYVARALREGALFTVGAIALYLMMALLSYDSRDPGWSHSRDGETVFNAGGAVGAWFGDVLMSLFGYLSYLFPLMLGYGAWLLYSSGRAGLQLSRLHWWLVGLGFVLTMAAGSGLAAIFIARDALSLPGGAGGILGELTGTAVVGAFSFPGTALLLMALFLSGVTLFTGLSWITTADRVGHLAMLLMRSLRGLVGYLYDLWLQRRARQQRQEVLQEDKLKQQNRPKVVIEKPKPPIEASSRALKERQATLFETADNGELPPLSLLDEAEPPKNPVSPATLEATSRQVELKLRDFGVEAQVVAVHPGPVITRYELQPAPGVKVSQISNLSKDLARSLSVASVRIVDVIAGKSVVGLEIPNENREMVRLSEILQSAAFDKSSTILPLALGKDISGQPVVVDLAKMPHLLVAGTTGSGKSVAVNAMILSLIYSATARDLRMIMIDPKMLELSVYEGIPHLLTPVVTDMKDAASALRWSVAEMERRYALLASQGVRNLASFNRKVAEAKQAGTPIRDPFFTAPEGIEPRMLETLPNIVVVIDELADMMMIVGKKVEQLIARLAQKARASGIHLVLATQRPSVDVLTGLIKANIPTRIAFQVSSKIDSRTILDQMGAEQLLGHGDMLYLPPGTSVPVRVHGAFVDDHEVHRVVDHLKKGGEPEYLDGILSGDGEAETKDGFLNAVFGGDSSGEQDPLYDEAVRFVTDTRRVSISSVQRRFKVGYNRAARIVEDMERAGVVGPQESNGSREVIAPPAVVD